MTDHRVEDSARLARKYRGAGHLEETGYIPAGSAAERELSLGDILHRRIAALFVETNGAYFGLEGVDPWDKPRDAMKYAGPYPVIAHPECSRWSQLAYINQKRYGHKVGDDGGMFAFALDAVRRWGGVLEHPARTYA